MATKATLYGNSSGGMAVAKTIDLPTPFASDGDTYTATDNIFWSKVTVNPKAIKQASIAGDMPGNLRTMVFTFGSGVTISKLLSVEIFLVGGTSSPWTNVHNARIMGMYLFPADDGYIANGATGFTVLKFSNVSNSGGDFDVISDNDFAVTYSGNTMTISAASSAYGFLALSAGSTYATIRYI